MALICNDVNMKGNQIWCKHTGTPCGHVRYCSVSDKYYQTDNAMNCTIRRKKDE